MTDVKRRFTDPVSIISGPISREPEVLVALRNAALQGNPVHGHGLPSYTDPVTAHAAGAPNSGHTPGTPHPAELDYIVAKGDHKASDQHDCTKADCEHVGQTEPRPNPVAVKHHGKPYEDDPEIAFLTVISSDPSWVQQAAEAAGWTLRSHVPRVAVEVVEEPEFERRTRDRLAKLEERTFGGFMTANSPPYVLQAGSHSAQLFRQALSTLLNSAGGIVASGDYLVTQNGTPNMSVNVAGGIPGGQIWVPGTTSALVQGLYYGFNDAVVNLAIAASNPSNPRIDIAVAQVQDAAYTGATSSFQLAIVTGTPAGSPVAPSTPASSLVLANIAVAALATTVVTANITDKRFQVGVNAGLSSPWTTITLSGVVWGGGDYVPAFRAEAGGIVRLKGAFQNTSGSTITANTAFCTALPAAVRPATTINLGTATGINASAGTLALLAMTAAGTLTANVGLTTTSVVTLNGMSYSTS